LGAWWILHSNLRCVVGRALVATSERKPPSMPPTTARIPSARW
jgi:hypothetical protein